MKFVIRRFIFSVITIPVILGLYFLLWAVLIGLGAQDNGMFYSNLGFVSLYWLVMFTFGPNIMKFVDNL